MEFVQNTYQVLGSVTTLTVALLSLAIYFFQVKLPAERLAREKRLRLLHLANDARGKVDMYRQLGRLDRSRKFEAKLEEHLQDLQYF